MKVRTVERPAEPVDYAALALAKPTRRVPVEAEAKPESGLRRTRLRPFNRRRMEQRERENFGDWAEIIRALPCANCAPEFYADNDELLSRIYRHLAAVARLPRASRSICEASHALSRGAGGDKSWLVPQCPRHHAEYGQGEETFTLRHGSMRMLAQQLWKGLGHDEDECAELVALLYPERADG